ncbi:MAG TPA: PAS domain-containing protein [Gemmatimonadales bacterium]
MTEDPFLELADLLPEAILLVSDDGRIRNANRASAEILGSSAAELVGRPLQTLVTEEPERVIRWLRLCSGSREALPGAFNFRRAGDPLECRCDGVLLHPGDAESPSILLLRALPRHESSARFRALNETIDSLWAEIAERRRVEEALRASEALTGRILSSTGDCITVLDLDGRLLSVNEPGCAALSLGDSESYLGQPWADLWRPEDRAAAARAVVEARETGVGRFYGASTHPEAGTRFWDVLITPILDVGSRPERLVAVARDTTERRLAEEQLRQSAKMEAIGRLAGGLAHDFNNHLHVQSGLIGLILRDPATTEESQRDLLEIQSVTEHMARLTRQLLAFSRQQVLQLETLDLNRVVMDGQHLLQRLIGGAVDVRVELSAGPCWVHADRAQLLQVLLNLAINSRDAMRGGGLLEIATAVQSVNGGGGDLRRVIPVPPGDFVQLRVSDTGTGIAPDHLPHIFEPFFTTKPIGEGTGLGLATVHGIVSQCRGHVWAESEPGAGSRFTILLPLQDAPAQGDGVSSKGAP